MQIKVQVVATGSNGNAIILTIDDKKLLLDCGVTIDTIRRANNYKLSDITACLVTHQHKDHSLAVKELLNACVPMHMSQEVADYCGCNEYANTIRIADASTSTIEKGITIVYIEQEHDCHCVSYDILLGDSIHPHTVVHYVVDTAKIHCRQYPKDTKHIWLCECNYTPKMMAYIDNTEGADTQRRNIRTRQTHLSSDTFVEFFKETAQQGSKVLVLHRSTLNFSMHEFRDKICELNRCDVDVEIAWAGRNI
ncbi:MAG: MBL fold metallo-hydrolase [Clostridiales bacterium]|jgi:hypothetical protein|nr:MBL fold metallo-hydrolase [Clostridiales bacterium]